METAVALVRLPGGRAFILTLELVLNIETPLRASLRRVDGRLHLRSVPHRLKNRAAQDRPISAG
jgi:hypothetical protein